jgi:hypothetical protein
VNVLSEAKQLANELRAIRSDRATNDRELLRYVNRLVVSLAANGEDQVGAARMLQWYCVENMDWSSPPFIRCEGLVNRALAQR